MHDHCRGQESAATHRIGRLRLYRETQRPRPGQALAPETLGGPLREIVKPENRILNPFTKLTEYIMDADDQEDPQPSDSYDGANVGDDRSWGVVDGTCDGIIEAQLVVDGVRYVATARVLSSCPDFAPDRRPVSSFADDLTDREEPPVPVETIDDAYETLDEVADLFERAFETASPINLDANRYRDLIACGREFERRVQARPIPSAT
jgi:hypothetical protein